MKWPQGVTSTLRGNKRCDSDSPVFLFRLHRHKLCAWILGAGFVLCMLAQGIVLKLQCALQWSKHLDCAPTRERRQRPLTNDVIDSNSSCGDSMQSASSFQCDPAAALPTSHRAAVRSVLSSVANTFTIPEETASDLDATKEMLARNAGDTTGSICARGAPAAAGAAPALNVACVYVPSEVKETEAVSSGNDEGAGAVFESS